MTQTNSLFNQKQQGLPGTLSLPQGGDHTPSSPHPNVVSNFLKSLMEVGVAGLKQLPRMAWTACQVLYYGGQWLVVSMISTALVQFARQVNQTLDDEHWLSDAELDHRIERWPTGIFCYLCPGVPRSIDEMRKVWADVVVMDAGIYWNNLPTDLLEELHRWGNTFSEDKRWYRGLKPGNAPTPEPEVAGYRVSRLVLWHRVSPSVAVHILAGLRSDPARWKKMLLADLESRAFIRWPQYEVFSQEGQALGDLPATWIIKEGGDNHAEEKRLA